MSRLIPFAKQRADDPLPITKFQAVIESSIAEAWMTADLWK